MELVEKIKNRELLIIQKGKKYGFFTVLAKLKLKDKATYSIENIKAFFKEQK